MTPGATIPTGRLPHEITVLRDGCGDGVGKPGDPDGAGGVRAGLIRFAGSYR